MIQNFHFVGWDSFRKLLSYRLVYYKATIISTLIRFKHGLLVLVALFVPTLAAIHYLLTKPLLVITHANRLTIGLVVNILLLYIVYWGYLYLQRRAVVDDAHSYLSAQPLSKFEMRLIDIITIIVANNILWIPFLISCHALGLNGSIRLMFLGLSILSFQVNSIHLKPVNLILTIVINVLFLSSLTQYLSPYANAFQSSCVLMLFFPLFFSISLVNNVRLRTTRYFQARKVNKNLRFPLLKLNSYVISKRLKYAFFLRMLSCILLIIIGLGILVLGKHYSYLQSISFIICFGFVFIISGLSFRLHEEKEKYRSYLNTIPVNRLSFLWADLSTLLLISLAMTVLYFISIYFYVIHDLLFPLKVMIFQVPLMAVLYFFQVKLKIFGTFISAAVYILWALFFLCYVGA